jgi:hypothetical protein
VQHPHLPGVHRADQLRHGGHPRRLEAWADGVLVQTFSVVAAPGSTQHFTAYANNPFFSHGRGQVHWLVRIRPT